ncbi:unnamed protein product [Oikopleura dioica]|uniref:acylphosphatase n=1 Tax=Oikopleura dioica TaxID=34765 RepID=E4XCW5_OIKDI|nr:unnamed protein product [Oikopleura dioica]
MIISFEVHGKVQKVFFRKYTKQAADKLGIFGWVENTRGGTVIGEACGPADKMEKFELFLSRKGSPKSRIDRCDITKLSSYIEQECNYTDFIIRR